MATMFVSVVLVALIGISFGFGDSRDELFNKKAIFKDTTCELCTVIITELEYLELDAFEDWLKNTAYSTCIQIAPSESEECKLAVDFLMNWLNSTLHQPPAQVCADFGLCNADTRSMAEHARMLRLMSSMLHVDKVTGVITCEACKFGVKELESMLLQNMTAVKQKVDDICRRLPAPIDEECMKIVNPFIENYLPVLLNTTMSPGNVCKVLDACTGTVSKVHLPLKPRKTGVLGKVAEEYEEKMPKARKGFVKILDKLRHNKVVSKYAKDLKNIFNVL